jgi:hypothetical protein
MSSQALTYTQYLKIDELLSLNQPQSDEHDEPLFIAIHQVYELWFKQILHEFSAAQRTLEAGDTFASLATLGRIRTILKTCVSQLDILETMTPLQFNSFRDRLTSGSGFQSAQFRELEAVLGRRDHAGAGAGSGTGMGMSEHLVAGSPAPSVSKTRWHAVRCGIRLFAILSPVSMLCLPTCSIVTSGRPMVAMNGSRTFFSLFTVMTPRLDLSANHSWTSTKVCRSGDTVTSKWSNAPSETSQERVVQAELDIFSRHCSTRSSPTSGPFARNSDFQ